MTNINLLNTLKIFVIKTNVKAMKRIFLIFCFLFIYLSCKEDRVRYFYGNNEVIKLEKNITIFNVRDSIDEIFEMKKGRLINEKGQTLKYYISDSSFVLNSTKNEYYNEFINNVLFKELEKCWTLDDSRYDICICLKEGKFIIFNNSDLYEEGDFLVSNDFNTYYIFNTNSVKFFSDSFYAIDILNDSIFTILDLKNKKKLNFYSDNKVNLKKSEATSI